MQIVVYMHASFGCSINVYTEVVPVCLESELLRDAAISFCSLSTKSRQTLARRATYTFAIHSGLVHDVTDTAGHKMAALSVFAFGDFQT